MIGVHCFLYLPRTCSKALWACIKEESNILDRLSSSNDKQLSDYKSSAILLTSIMVLKPSFVAILASLASVEVANAWFRFVILLFDIAEDVDRATRAVAVSLALSLWSRSVSTPSSLPVRLVSICTVFMAVATSA